MKNLQITKRVTPRNDKTVDRYLRDIAQYDLLSLDEESRLPQLIKQGDHAALERMVTGNLRFVVSVAKNYQDMGLELSDLISAGNIGLITAAEKFDPTMGFKFCSYAVWWIRQSILQALSKDGRMVALPANQQQLLSKLDKEAVRLEQELQRKPTMEELAERLELDDRHLRWLGRNVERPLSLDTRLQADEDATRIDIIADTDTPSADSELMHESLQAEIGRVLSILPQNERDVIKMSFGIDQQHPCTLSEIAMLMGVSRERVRQMHKNAIKRLSHSSAKEGLRAYL